MELASSNKPNIRRGVEDSPCKVPEEIYFQDPEGASQAATPTSDGGTCWGDGFQGALEKNIAPVFYIGEK